MATILYIDDDKYLSESLVNGLETCGHSVQFENTAKAAARTIASDTPFDIVVLDIMMRLGQLERKENDTQTGYILYRLVREARGPLPIVVHTVCAFHEAPQSLREDPHIHWMKKPVLFSELAQLIDDLIKTSRKRTST